MELSGDDLCRTGSSGETSPRRQQRPAGIFRADCQTAASRTLKSQGGREARSKANWEATVERRQKRRVPRWQQQGNGEGRTHPTEIPKLRQLLKYETPARHQREHLDILERSMNLWSEAWVPAPSHSLPTNNHATEEQVTW